MSAALVQGGYNLLDDFADRAIHIVLRRQGVTGGFACNVEFCNLRICGRVLDFAMRCQFFSPANTPTMIRRPRIHS